MTPAFGSERVFGERSPSPELRAAGCRVVK